METIVESAKDSTSKETTQQDIIFKHGTNSSNHRFTMAIEGPIKGDTLKVAIALCSKKNQFSKKRGRIISSRRLEKNKRVLNLVIDSTKNVRDNINNIFDTIVSKGKPELISDFNLVRK